MGRKAETGDNLRKLILWWENQLNLRITKDYKKKILNQIITIKYRNCKHYIITIIKAMHKKIVCWGKI